MKKSFSKTLIFIIFIACIFGAILYYFYSESSFSEKSSITQNTPKPSINTENLYQDSKIIEDDEDNSSDIVQYLIVKVKNKWYEVTNQKQFSSNLVVLGTKNNILYYSDSEGIKYVDLTNNSYEPLKLFEFNASECENVINQGFIYKDNIYLNISTSCNNSKFVSFSLNSHRMKTLIDDIGTNFYEYDDSIYYLDYNGDMCKNTKFTKYNISDNKTSIIDNNICFIKGNGNKILFSKLDNSSNDFSIYSYDLSNMNKNYIDKGTPFEIYNGTLYYGNGSNIIKYDDGNKSIIYNGLNGFFGGIKIIDSDKIIINSSSGEKYLINNKLVSEDIFRTSVDSYNTIMKDGSTKDFSSIDTVS